MLFYVLTLLIPSALTDPLKSLWRHNRWWDSSMLYQVALWKLAFNRCYPWWFLQVRIKCIIRFDKFYSIRLTAIMLETVPWQIVRNGRRRSCAQIRVLRLTRLTRYLLFTNKIVLRSDVFTCSWLSAFNVPLIKLAKMPIPGLENVVVRTSL